MRMRDAAANASNWPVDTTAGTLSHAQAGGTFITSRNGPSRLGCQEYERT